MGRIDRSVRGWRVPDGAASAADEQPLAGPAPLRLDDQGGRIHVQRFAEPLEEIQLDAAALPRLEVADRRLAHADGVGELGLCQPRRLGSAEMKRTAAGIRRRAWARCATRMSSIDVPIQMCAGNVISPSSA
jgi:hypothetical protein